MQGNRSVHATGMICHLLCVCVLQEVIARLWAMSEERLYEFERKEVGFNKVKACIEDVSDIIYVVSQFIVKCMRKMKSNHFHVMIICLCPETTSENRMFIYDENYEFVIITNNYNMYIMQCAFNC